MFCANLFSRIVAAPRSAIKKNANFSVLLCHTKSVHVNPVTVKAKAIIASFSDCVFVKKSARLSHSDVITESIEWRLIVHGTVGAIELINHCNCHIISSLMAAIHVNSVPQISPSTVELIVLVSMGVLSEKSVEVDVCDLVTCCEARRREGTGKIAWRRMFDTKASHNIVWFLIFLLGHSQDWLFSLEP